MSKRYDVIVIGAGNGGLAAAATTAKGGLKTLLLEQHNLPGGSATSFCRGRFEFETSLHELADVGSAEQPGSVRQLFDSLGAEVDWRLEDNAFRVISEEDGFDAVLPVGIDAFADEMERQVPGCRDSVLAVFDLAKKAGAAIAYLSSGPVDPKVLAAQHTDFMRMASHTVDECLDALGMPKKAQYILSTYWPYLGVPTDQLDFLHYAFMLMRYVVPHPAMPYMRSHELSLSLEKVILDHGGEVWYNSKAEKLLVKDGAVYGVVAGGQEIYADHVISNSFPDNVYSTMMEADQVPKQALKLANARKLGLSFVTVYLGMNRTAKELGIHDYSVFVERSGNSRKQYNDCQTLEDGGYVIMNCLNNVIPDSSPEGTCTLFFTGMYFGDAWKDVKTEEYRKLKNRIASEMIENCERTLGISIKPYIEEIVIAAPPTFARYLNTPTGTPYGYENNRWDGMLPRIMTMKDEQFIKGLRFCGAHGERTDGYSSAYMSGANAGKLTINDRKEGK